MEKFPWSTSPQDPFPDKTLRHQFSTSTVYVGPHRAHELAGVSVPGSKKSMIVHAEGHEFKVDAYSSEIILGPQDSNHQKELY